MKTIVILVFIFLVSFSCPVLSQAPTAISQEAKKKFLPLMNEVLQPIFRDHQKRIKTVAFLEVCKDSEKADKIYDQKIIEQDIYERVQDAATKFTFSNEELDHTAMMIVSYVEGFTAGYGAAVQTTISNDEELKKLCDYAEKAAITELGKSK